MTSGATIRELISEAKRIELTGAHDFNQLDKGTGLRLRDTDSPKKSRSGLYYLECHRCQRVLFEGKQGSATGVFSDCRQGN